MIVPMKKLWLICRKADRDATLDRLAELGVVHVTPLVPPEGEAIDAARERVTSIQHALGVLPRDIPKEAPGIDHSLSAPAVMHRIESYLIDRQKTETRITELRTEIDRIEPFGDFDPQRIASLAKGGITVRLVRFDKRKPPAFPEGVQMHVLSTLKGYNHAALISADPFDIEYETAPPRESLATLRKHLHDCQVRLARITKHLSYMAAYRPLLEGLLASMNDQHEMLFVSAGMGDTHDLAYLEGYCPSNDVEAISADVHQYGWGLIVRDPEKNDQVPTLIRNSKWIRPIQSLFNLLAITPGYREIDISAAFMFFYAIFFAMLVGDAGYGFVLLALTFALRRFLPRMPRDVSQLLGILSVCTILWGTVTGTWFGIAALPAPFRAVRIEWLRDDDNLMRLCFLLGAIHLTLAHAWVAVRSWRRLTALAEVGWIAVTWAIYFGVGLLVLGSPFPSFAGWLFAVGIGLVVLFMTPPRDLKTDFHKHVMLPLTLVGNFGDLISYVRLFAVGSATAAIAMAFNELALGSGISGPGQALVSSLILLAAHTLNILLCALAVLVHGVRLNTLEFCGQMGIQWNGFPYKPFSKERTNQ